MRRSFNFGSGPAVAAVLMVVSSALSAAPVPINTADASNGISDIYSATFDGGLIPCNGSSPSYCNFFGGLPGAARAIAVTPDPTGVINGVPTGFAAPPTAGSFLDLTLANGNTQLTLTGGTIAFPNLSLTISSTTVISASGAGMVFDPAAKIGAVNASGQAEFLVNLAPANAADFSTLSAVVTGCTGPLCGLVGALSLDMLKYRLFIDYDPSFTSFTADFIGQTSNNSMVFATLNSAVIPAPAAGWLLLPAVAAVMARARRRRS